MADDNMRAMLAFEARKKSAGATYLLWFFTGGLGGHRFYLGKIGTALIIAALTVLTFAGFTPLFLILVPWLLIDLLRISGWVEAANVALAHQIGGRPAAAAPANRPPPLPAGAWAQPLQAAKVVRWRDVGLLFAGLAAVVAVVYGVGVIRHAKLKPPVVEQPAWTASTLPETALPSAPVIRMPGEPRAIYTAEQVTKMTDGLAHIVSKRVGPAGTTYTKRECRCAAATSRTLGSGETLDQMQASPMDPKHSPLMMNSDGMGSSAFHACEHACAAIGSRLDRTKTR